MKSLKAHNNNNNDNNRIFGWISRSWMLKVMKCAFMKVRSTFLNSCLRNSRIWSPILLLRENGEGSFILCFVEGALMYRARHKQCLSPSLCPVSTGHTFKYEIFILSTVFTFFQVQGLHICDVMWSYMNRNCVFVLLNRVYFSNL
jgi:hypothetical protein